MSRSIVQREFYVTARIDTVPLVSLNFNPSWNVHSSGREVQARTCGGDLTEGRRQNPSSYKLTDNNLSRKSLTSFLNEGKCILSGCSELYNDF